MKFDDLDNKMRRYEQSLDVCILPEIFLVVRIDGRSFHTLTKESGDFAVPFDEKFRDYMVGTVSHLMQCGFKIAYGYTESDEISLLFHADEQAFGRKTRKLNSILAGEASAAFTHLYGKLAAFDCRVIPLPTQQLVVDYFRWRQEDANRNALNAHTYWLLRKEGISAKAAAEKLDGKSIAEKNELLFQRGINYNDLPSWQKRGVGLWWENYEKVGINPLDGTQKSTMRRRLKTEYELPLGEAYSALIMEFLNFS